MSGICLNIIWKGKSWVGYREHKVGSGLIISEVGCWVHGVHYPSLSTFMYV